MGSLPADGRCRPGAGRGVPRNRDRLNKTRANFVNIRRVQPARHWLYSVRREEVAVEKSLVPAEKALQ
jgi:hypothetical protein